ncbi:hypothetical protein ACLOJK_037882 [Asimina triloba]
MTDRPAAADHRPLSSPLKEAKRYSLPGLQMALEFPSAIIDRIQSRLRSEAGIPSFDPDRPSAHLPSLEEAIAGSEPSPPYLRCSQCRGRLLRGIQSMICVYCGSVQRRSGPPQSLSFNTTSAYRRLLESLQADGSSLFLGRKAEIRSAMILAAD